MIRKVKVIEKSDVKTIRLECPGCAAQMLVDMEHHRAYCEYCGKVMLLDYDFSDTVSPSKEKEPETEEVRELLRKKRLKEAMDAEDRVKAEERTRLGLDVWSTYSPPVGDSYSEGIIDSISSSEGMIDYISEKFPPAVAIVLISAIILLIAAVVVFFFITVLFGSAL